MSCGAVGHLKCLNLCSTSCAENLRKHMKKSHNVDEDEADEHIAFENSNRRAKYST